MLHPTLSIRQRILVSMGLVLAVLVTGLVSVLVYSMRAALEETGRHVNELAAASAQQQSEVVDRVCAKALRDDEAALRTKAESLARLTARLAPVALLTYQSEPLEDYCSQVCSDRDVLVCYVTDRLGKIRAGAHHAQIAVLPPGPGQSSADVIADLAHTWRKAGKALEVSAEVVQDQQRIGGVVVLASRQRVVERQRETQTEFDRLQAGADRLFGSLQRHLDKQIQEKSHRTMWLGIVAALIAAALGGWAVYRLATSLTRSLERTVSVLEAMAAGDLTQRLPVERPDEMGRMAEAMNTAVEAQQRTLEDLRCTKEEAETANRAKSEFLANMSHEIRTPLNAILGFTGVLRVDLEGFASPEAREHLDIVQASGRHLLALINDILDLSKIEAGQLKLERVDCSPAELLAEVLSLLRVRSAEKGLTLSSRWPHGVPETIHSDPARLRQLLMNLVGNAIKFTEQGGVEVVMDLEQAGLQWWLAMRVTDTGPGIPADKLEAIFDPFVQADCSVTRKYGGTGLGLAICRRIVEALGGSLIVCSEPGLGSTFRAAIPLGTLHGVAVHEAPPADAVAPRARPLAAHVKLPPARILLVEDGESNRKLIRILLTRAGAEVTCAENGQIGCDLALAQPFDVILMDMQMPVLDGYQATIRLRQAGLSVPIVALTAHAMSGDDARCREAGCSGYLSKPVQPDLLLNSVAELLRSPAGVSAPPATMPPAPEPLYSRLPLDDAELREIVDLFIDSLRGKIEALRRAWALADFDDIARLAHWLKGSGGTAGFDEFTEPARQLELLAKARTRERLDQAVADMFELASRVFASTGPHGTSAGSLSRE
jgi:signal transduction histidine kinase/HPt (histidine-containing phosphotransfer) domain-containing protein/ActR/RegA family two-component response regulator